MIGRPDSVQPTLILLHGATCNGHMWDPLVRGLDARYRVLTPDLPGHGSRRDEPFTLAAAVATVVASAQSVAPAPIIVGGDSLGGYTTLAASAALPRAQLKGLILGGSSSNLRGRTLLPYYARVALFRVLLAVFGEQRLISRSIPKLKRELHMQNGELDAMFAAGMSIRVFEQAVFALRNIDFRAKLAAVEQPVLIINGAKDTGHIREEPSFVAVARDARTHRFADCEHGVTLRRPAQCAVLFNQFAERVFATSAQHAA